MRGGAINREVGWTFTLDPVLLTFSRIIDTPKVSNSAKHDALNLLHDELGGDPPRHQYDDPSMDTGQDSDGQAGDLER